MCGFYNSTHGNSTQHFDNSYYYYYYYININSFIYITLNSFFLHFFSSETIIKLEI
jgi:hypothetical protein